MKKKNRHNRPTVVCSALQLHTQLPTYNFSSSFLPSFFPSFFPPFLFIPSSLPSSLHPSYFFAHKSRITLSRSMKLTPDMFYSKTQFSMFFFRTEQIQLISLVFCFFKPFLGLIDTSQNIISSLNYQCQLVLYNSTKNMMKILK